MLDPADQRRHFMTTDIIALSQISAGLVSDGSPCGPDLEYTPDFLAFLALASAKEEQQVGDQVLPRQEPDWNAVYKSGVALLTDSRDVRVITEVARATLHKFGIAAFSETLDIAAGWLEEHWDDLHPRLNIDGEFDPLMRTNAVAGLANPNGMLRSFRAATLVDSPIGSLTVAQVDRIASGKDADPHAPIQSLEQLQRLLVDEQARNRPSFDALARIKATLHRIGNAFRQQLDSDYWPDLAPFAALVDRLIPLMQPAHELQSSDASAVSTSTAADAQSGTPAARPRADAAGLAIGLPETIELRSDAVRALSLARGYYERHEPSHPAPLLIRRIERLADLNFLDIVRELTPEALSQLELITGGDPESRR